MSQRPPEEAGIDYDPDEDSFGNDDEVAKVKARHEARLMAMEGVTGVGIGMDDIGEPCIQVYLRDADAKSVLPEQIDGVKVTAEVTGDIDAQ